MSSDAHPYSEPELAALRRGQWNIHEFPHLHSEEGRWFATLDQARIAEGEMRLVLESTEYKLGEERRRREETERERDNVAELYNIAVKQNVEKLQDGLTKRWVDSEARAQTAEARIKELEAEPIRVVHDSPSLLDKSQRERDTMEERWEAAEARVLVLEDALRAIDHPSNKCGHAEFARRALSSAAETPPPTERQVMPNATDRLHQSDERRRRGDAVAGGAHPPTTRSEETPPLARLLKAVEALRAVEAWHGHTLSCNAKGAICVSCLTALTELRAAFLEWKGGK